MILISVTAVLSGLVQLMGYIVYSRHVVFGVIRPNAASWSIWAFGAVVESLSYIFLTGDFLKNILPIVCAFSAVIFFIVCTIRGYFGKVTNFEIIVIVTDILITVLWFVTDSPLLANILFILLTVVSFIPIIRRVYMDPTYEDAFPWFVWTLAYILQIVVVVVRFEKVEDLIYPVIFVVLHFVVALLSIDRRKNKLSTVHRHFESSIPEHL